jgi:hypothetical protein
MTRTLKGLPDEPELDAVPPDELQPATVAKAMSAASATLIDFRTM